MPAFRFVLFIPLCYFCFFPFFFSLLSETETDRLVPDIVAPFVFCCFQPAFLFFPAFFTFPHPVFFYPSDVFSSSVLAFVFLSSLPIFGLIRCHVFFGLLFALSIFLSVCFNVFSK